MDDFYLVAKIIAGSGKSGYVRISSFSDFPDRFFELKKVYIDFFGAKKPFIVEEVKRKKDYFTIKFENFSSDEEIQVLIGKEIFVGSSELIELPAGTFFIHDLTGSTVYQSGAEIGIITDVLQFPGNDVYVVVKEGKEILIPAVLSYIESFDPQKKVMIIKADVDLSDDDEN